MLLPLVGVLSTLIGGFIKMDYLEVGCIIHLNRWVYQNGLPRGGMYGHAVVKVLLGGTHLHSHTEALVKKSIAKEVSQLFDL